MNAHDLRRQITNTIIDALKNDALPPWRKPWQSCRNVGAPANVVSLKPYSGVNPMLLEIFASRHGFTSRYWGTFNQWRGLGGSVMRRPPNVRPGHWGCTVVFCRPITKTEIAPDGEEIEESFWLLRSYTVFNVDQVEGEHLNHLRASDEPLEAEEIQDRFDRAEQVIAATKADIRYRGDQAFYNPRLDFIQMPPRSRFSLPEFYETLFHELCHWVEHPSRLNWDRKLPQNSYALGELIAELGGCYMASELGVPTAHNLTNHSAYLKHWLEALERDSKWIFRAASQASRAVDYIQSFSKQDAEVLEPAGVFDPPF